MITTSPSACSWATSRKWRRPPFGRISTGSRPCSANASEDKRRITRSSSSAQTSLCRTRSYRPLVWDPGPPPVSLGPGITLGPPCSVTFEDMRMMFVFERCRSDLPDDVGSLHFQSLRQLVLGASTPSWPGEVDLPEPLWLRNGTEEYAVYAHQGLDGDDDPEWLWSKFAAHAVATTQPLASIERRSVATGPFETSALGLLATDWLADYSVYVAADTASVTPPFMMAFWMASGATLPQRLCHFGSGSVALFVTLECGTSLAHYSATITSRMRSWRTRNWRRRRKRGCTVARRGIHRRQVRRAGVLRRRPPGAACRRARHLRVLPVAGELGELAGGVRRRLRRHRR